MKQIYEIIIDMISVSDERMMSAINTYEIEKGEKLIKDKDDIGKLREFLRSDRYKVEVSKGYINSLTFSPIETVVNSITNMSWEFLITPTNCFFITSDNPVILHDKNHLESFRGIGYESSPTVELYFPISPQVCLHAQWLKHRRSNEYISRVAESDCVSEINRLVADYCNNYIFSCLDNFCL